MPWAAAAVVGGAVIGGAVASRSADKAADAQAESAQLASDTELEMFEQNREDYAPWREAGVGALSQLTAGTKPGGEYMRDFGMADFEADPGYEFRQTEGRRMLEGSAAGRGGLLSGLTLKALSKYGQDLASQEYGSAYNRYNADLDRRFNRLSGIAGTGQTATRDVAQMGSQTASNIAQNQIGAGNARASGYVAQGNAMSGVANSAGQYMQLRDLMKTTPKQANPGWYGGGGQTWDGSAADPWYG